MFDSVGFPYVSGSQIPRSLLPEHSHESGTYHIKEPGETAGDDGNQGNEQTSAEVSRDYGAHMHAWSNLIPITSGENNNEGKGNQNEENQGATDIKLSGGHGHSSSVFLGDSGQAGDLTRRDITTTFIPPSVSYAAKISAINHFVVSGYGSGSNNFVNKKHFAYDVKNSNVYSQFSNWISYTKDDPDYTTTVGNTEKADSAGQKFITPPFKGTIMAINLRGLTNPNRLGSDGKPSTIKKLHYVAGVPLCGAIRTDSITDSDEYEMSWFSTEVGQNSLKYASSYVSFNASNGRNLDGIPNNITDVTGGKVFGWFKDNFYEYGYKVMSRNDDTMHPYTYFSTSSQIKSNSQLDYNSYAVNNKNKYIYDLYKTNLTRENDFDL